MIHGKKIYLTSIDKDNLNTLREWRNNPELRQYFREHRELSMDMQTNWYVNKVLGDPNQYNFEIHDNESKKLIGHCGLYYINWISKSAEFGIYIGDFSFRNGGYGSDSLRTLIDYGFNQLNMNRIWAEVYSNNDAIKVYTKIGFKIEGVLRQNVFKNGEYFDSTIISLLKSEYEDIKNERK
jgi:UDP-4-amino-4,6-dideoxy-N-acetyl-beta-L-altrosamine N-acetyltransferase